jgi:hypothetical protein
MWDAEALNSAPLRGGRVPAARRVAARFLGLGMMLAAAVWVGDSPAGATDVLPPAASVSFAPTEDRIVNPERGFWLFLADDFATVTRGEIAEADRLGVSLGYGVVRLDRFRQQRLSRRLLDDLDTAFAKARKGGIKIILRFVYNYPQNEDEYRNAKDAPLDRVLQHIDQLEPVLARNADVIAVLQAGVIGAWGEGHTSSNHLDRPAAKQTIRDALLAALPAGRMLQWRYPPDLIDWNPEPPAAGSLGSIGIHNDCFLSSPTDVGTYSERKRLRERQRAYVMTVSRATLFSGETCAAEPRELRSSCDAILEEGADFHVTALNLTYYNAFHRRWRREGCYDQVDRSLGHRLRLVAATLAPREAGAPVEAKVSIVNDGWARLYSPRPLVLTFVHEPSGREFAVASDGDIRGVEPENAKPTKFAFTWQPPADAPSGSYDLLVGLPDLAPQLSDDVRFAVKFANAERPGSGQRQDSLGRFSTGLTLDLE